MPHFEEIARRILAAPRFVTMRGDRERFDYDAVRRDVELLEFVCFGAARCHICGRSDSRLTLDHLIPVSTGGCNHAHNMRLACWNCNDLRSNRQTEITFRSLAAMSVSLQCMGILGTSEWMADRELERLDMQYAHGPVPPSIAALERLGL